MTTKQFAITLSTIVASIFFTPEIDSLLKVYVISVVAFITMLVNLIFRFQKIREWVVSRLTADVREKLFNDYDFRKVFDAKLKSGNKDNV